MTRVFLLSLTFAALASASHAACYADYKAKRDDPLRLHYGVAEITGDCTTAAAAQELPPRLDAGGWQLLSVEGVFDDAGLEERQENAGENYLRY